MFAARFTLILPADAETSRLAAALPAVLAPGRIEAVIVPAGGDGKAQAERAKALVPLIQAAGAAALLEAPEDARLVARSGAAGAHYPFGHPDFREALKTLKPARIVGVGNLRTKHEAMEAGEADVDYLMFGEPRADGFTPEAEKTAERAAWWAEIFQIPCVAYAAGLSSVPTMAATHADFIALGPWLFESDASATFRAALAALTPETSR